jgi:hypothetical protein
MPRRMTIADKLNQVAGPGWRAVREPGAFSWHWTNGTLTIRAYSESRLAWDGYDDEHFDRVYVDDTGREWAGTG